MIHHNLNRIKKTVNRARSIKLSTYIQNAVTTAKGFVVNKITNKINASDLISSFGATISKASGDGGAVAKLLEKSPFRISEGSGQRYKSHDRLKFQHVQYPAELTGNELGNWMLFFMITNTTNGAGMMDLEMAKQVGMGHLIEDHFKDLPPDESGKGHEKTRIDRIREQYKQKGIDIPKVESTNSNLAMGVNQLVTGAVALYMPPDVKVSYGADWNPEDTNTSGDVFNLINKMKTWTDDESALNMVHNFGKAGLGITVKLLKEWLGGATEMAGMGDIAKVLGKRAGMAMNPHKEQFYEGPMFREFSYQFKFWPRNPDETNRASDIIKMFKYHMHPYKDPFLGDRIFRVPSEFEIHYLHNTGINEHLHRIARCALKKVDVSYTPESGNFKTFDDHSPVTYTLDLTFVELEYMTKDKILEGY